MMTYVCILQCEMYVLINPLCSMGVILSMGITRQLRLWSDSGMLFLLIVKVLYWDKLKKKMICQVLTHRHLELQEVG